MNSKIRTEKEHALRIYLEENVIPFVSYYLIHINKAKPRYIADSRTMSLDEIILATRQLPIFSIDGAFGTNDENGNSYCDIQLDEF